MKVGTKKQKGRNKIRTSRDSYIVGLIESMDTFGWDSEGLAQELGVTFNAVENWIQGRNWISSNNLSKIESLFGLFYKPSLEEKEALVEVQQEMVIQKKDEFADVSKVKRVIDIPEENYIFMKQMCARMGVSFSVYINELIAEDRSSFRRHWRGLFSREADE